MQEAIRFVDQAKVHAAGGDANKAWEWLERAMPILERVEEKFEDDEITSFSSTLNDGTLEEFGCPAPTIEDETRFRADWLEARAAGLKNCEGECLRIVRVREYQSFHFCRLEAGHQGPCT